MERLNRVSSVHLNTSIAKVWELLTQSEWTKQYMFNCAIISDFNVGSSIEWKGNFEGYEAHQKGIILACEPQKLLKYSTIDPNYGDPEVEENYIHVTYEMRLQNEGVLLTVVNETFDGDQERMKHIISGWEGVVLPKIAQLVESLTTSA